MSGPLGRGIAKEQARAALPEGLTGTTLYMAGTLRSWIHYCQLRMANGTQKEHQESSRTVLGYNRYTLSECNKSL